MLESIACYGLHMRPPQVHAGRSAQSLKKLESEESR
jgi:hypothetical protein